MVDKEMYMGSITNQSERFYNRGDAFISEAMKNDIKHFLDTNGVNFYKEPNAITLVDSELAWEKRDLRILKLAIEEGAIERVVDSVTKDDADRQWCLNLEIDELHDEYGIDKSFLIPILQGFQEAYIEKTLLVRGKSICNQLKEMRREFAAVNGIEYEEDDCDANIPCDGTCPYCDMKTRELIRKAQVAGSTRPILFPETEVDLIESNSIENEPIEEAGIMLGRI